MFKRFILLAVAHLLPTASFAGETVSQHSSLTLEGARCVIAAIETETSARHTTGAVAVVDAGGNLIALHRIDGTFPAGGNVSIGKARTAALFQKPTRVFEDIITQGRTPMIALNDFTPLRGGVPIVMDGQLVGAVGVSGASSAKEDDELAQIGADALVSYVEDSAESTATVISRDTVEAAYDQTKLGGVLYKSLVDGFTVHASRRGEPGRSEVHASQTDIFYIVSGRAEFVTGGRIVGGGLVESGELRGERIDGGDSRMIGAGDVAIVPAGTPHWFKSVEEPVHYLVVKVPIGQSFVDAR